MSWAENSGEIYGFNINNRCESISDLMFADELLLFSIVAVLRIF